MVTEEDTALIAGLLAASALNTSVAEFLACRSRGEIPGRSTTKTWSMFMPMS